MNKLPIVKVPYAAFNQLWVGEYIDGQCVNMDTWRLPIKMFDAEVLTLHLKTGKMRVRLIEPQLNTTHNKPEVVSFDTDISYFFNSHEIKEVTNGR